jgi:hypothetical protein
MKSLLIALVVVVFAALLASVEAKLKVKTVCGRFDTKMSEIRADALKSDVKAQGTKLAKRSCNTPMLMPPRGYWLASVPKRGKVSRVSVVLEPESPELLNNIAMAWHMKFRCCQRFEKIPYSY